MLKKKEGFIGEQMLVLPPMVIDLEEKDPLVSNLYLTDIGFYPNATYHCRTREEGCEQHILIYCVDGDGWCDINGKKQEIHENEYIIIPARTPHSYGAKEGNNWSIYWVHFQGSLAMYLADGAQIPQKICTNQSSRIENRNNLFDEIINTLMTSFDIEHLRYSSSLLYHYLASIRYLQTYREARPATQSQDKEAQDVVKAAIHYMKENIERKLKLEDIVKYIGYSQSHFSFIFKNETGCSPINYLNNLKIKRACKLLKETTMKINQISCRLGIEDSLYFSRLFTKAVGMSPCKYRDSLKKSITH